MESNKYKEIHNESEDQDILNAPSITNQGSSGESAAETVHLKDGPWHDKEKENKNNPEGKSIKEATDPSKLFKF
ncbi:hypothetical protein [Flavobacterium sp. SORGH_AS_0622]|jgi:hypothetical protein|uniref:hypothetical protein n=1 Tax=Flavobacterium sp. SORGH_AS_0622 TaxID=3041772 RepID=UPI00277DB56A|nr:hypothetical protein [Flavobacterium sp. SORGH_AS_0622]MDQ1166069.1 hypothetical protein [Flavobacterium sp. SORGH_AS_0622]